jgi:hypothetical protein
LSGGGDAVVVVPGVCFLLPKVGFAAEKERCGRLIRQQILSR